MAQRLRGWIGIGTILAAIAGTALAAPEKAWRGWERYQAVIWSTGAPGEKGPWIERLKEVGFTASQTGRGTSPAPFRASGLGYYVENLVPELGFLNNRRALYQEDFQGYTATRDRRFLVRKPCFDDPAFWGAQERSLPETVRPYRQHGPLLYDLRDELSIGSFGSPMDYCFCPHTLAAFRSWLREQYGSLERLNAEWDTRFAGWDDVAPLTTYEIKERERSALAAGKPENYAPWADHRAYMDLSFARTLDRMRGLIRRVDPDTPVGVEGTQMASAWGGYDLWRLSQVVDWIEPYDIGSSREMFRSFLPTTAPVLATVFGDDLPRLRARLWRLLLHGDRGCLVWDDEKSRCIETNAAGLPITERGRKLAPLLAELKQAAPSVMDLKRVDDRIAIHYSQASIRAHWMFDSREDKDTWPRRFSSYEAAHSRLARVRDSFVRLVEDLGLQYQFVSYEQVERGDLLRDGYRVLLLPRSVAMSAKECEQVTAFVRGGGTVITDAMAATMDEHCRRLPGGQLDPLFGVRRLGTGWRGQGEGGELAVTAPGSAPLRVFDPDLTVTTGKARLAGGRAPSEIERRDGKGRAVYLNLDLQEYGKERLQADTSDLRDRFGRLLADARVMPPVRVVRPSDGKAIACVEVWRYRGEGADAVAVMRNPEFRADSLGAVGYVSNARLEKPEPVRVLLPRRARVRDLRAGRELGMTDRVDLELDPWSPILLEYR